MGDILSKYDGLGAFGTTIYLAFFAALGSLVIGTVVAIMRVRRRRSPPCSPR